MRWLDSIKYSIWWNKLIHWEFWPTTLVNIPVLGFWLWFSLRARDLFFFSNTNPIIETGGVVGESKSNIFNHLPAWCLPNTIVVDLLEDKPQTITDRFRLANLDYPCIIKPDVGERGYLVEYIHDERGLQEYFRQVPLGKYLVQEYIHWPLELSIMYHRFPDRDRGAITSICIKKPLQITGDGVSTIVQLVHNYPRARMQWNRLKAHFDGERVLPEGKLLVLEPIGNHCRGATFLDGTHHLNPKLTNLFDEISRASTGMFYGRFDLKCKTIASLADGEDYCILEYNGVAAEPAHIYHPGRSLAQAYKDLWMHWKIIYDIHKKAKSLGYSTMKWSEARDAIKAFWKRPEVKVVVNAQ